jgi:hypothetical protein
LEEKQSLDAKILYVMEVGEHVIIEARTTGTEKIDNREDYWYYGNYNADDYIPVYGCFFGAYLGEDNADGKKWTPLRFLVSFLTVKPLHRLTPPATPKRGRRARTCAR